MRKPTAEEEAAAAKKARRARFEIADYVENNLDVDPAMSRSMEKGFDDSAFPLAKNFFDFITNPIYLKDVELRAKQLEAAINLLTDYCPLCSDLKYAKCIPYRHRAKKIRKRIVFLEHGRCPKCRITRTKIWKRGLLPRYTELAGLAGQRGGKTQLVAYIAAYTLHRFLMIQNPPVTYGLLPSTPLTLTFTAVTFKQAHQYLYTSFYNVVMHSSPWFKNYHEALDRFGARTGREVYRFKDTLFHYKHKNLFGMAEAPDSRSLRGATRWFASIDEIGHFNAKCLVGNSLVPTDEGLLTLEELKEQSSSNSEGFSDLNVGVCTHLGTKARTDKAFKSRGKTFVVETDCGERIEGLREHSMWSYCKGEMKFTRLDELPVGAYLPKSIGTKLFAKKSPTINFKRHISANAKILDDFTVPKKMTEGIGYLFGLFVAEGTRQGFFSNHNPALLDFFKDGLKKEFGASREFVYGLRNGKRDRVGVSLCKHVTAFFNHYLGSELSDKKVVPEIIRRSPAHIQTSFLRGLFEGDGTVYPYNKTKSYLVSYTSVSETLVRQVKALLENMGVLCHLALDETNPRKNSAYKPAHILFINRESYETFKAVAGFMPGSVKSQKLDKAIAYKETQIDKRTSRAFGRAHFVPARELILELYSELKEICSNTVYGYWYTSRTGNDVWVEKKYKLDAILHDSHHPARLQNGMEATKRSIDSIISAIEDAPTALRVNVSKNKRVTQIIKELRYMQQFYWTRIKSVKATNKTKPVFDLSVPGPHSYHVNSLIGHNTKDAIKINADEVHIALNRSLLTLRSASRRLHEEGYYDIPQPLFCNVSSPFSITDKICSLVEDAKRPNSPIYAFHYSSYKMNPTLTREDTRAEREADYTKYKRDYLAIPPMAANVFISSKSVIRSSFDPDLENLLDVTQRMVKTRTGRHMLTAEFEINDKHPRIDAPKILALDAGFSFNSFAGALVGIEESAENPNDYVFVTDALFEIIPEKEVPIDFSMLYSDLILPIIEQLGVVAVYADRWQSLKLLQDIISDTDEEVDAKTYSPTYGDFLQYRNHLTKGSIVLPTPEIEKFSTIMHFATRNYPHAFKGKPISHMVMQMMTVNDVFGKTIMKGDKLTDDLFRAHVLAVSAADDPEMIELLKAGRAGGYEQRVPIGILGGTGGITTLGGKGGVSVGAPGSGFGSGKNVPVLVSYGRPMGFY